MQLTNYDAINEFKGMFIISKLLKCFQTNDIIDIVLIDWHGHAMIGQWRTWDPGEDQEDQGLRTLEKDLKTPDILDLGTGKHDLYKKNLEPKDTIL